MIIAVIYCIYLAAIFRVGTLLAIFQLANRESAGLPFIA